MSVPHSDRNNKLTLVIQSSCCRFSSTNHRRRSVSGGVNNVGPDSCVDAQGRTTYAVYEDEIDGSSTAAVITGTLVEGSDHAFFTMSHTSASETLILGFDCALSGGNAICSDADSNSQPVTTTLAVQSIVLDVAETTAPPSTTASTGTTTAPGPTNKPSSAQKTSVSIFGVVEYFNVPIAAAERESQGRKASLEDPSEARSSTAPQTPTKLGIKLIGYGTLENILWVVFVKLEIGAIHPEISLIPEAAKFPRRAKNVAKEFFVDSISRVAATIRPDMTVDNKSGNFKSGIPTIRGLHLVVGTLRPAPIDTRPRSSDLQRIKLVFWVLVTKAAPGS
ncbi:hypothetical protein B0H13DRAFT_1919017 [Mycena leptocephala]|nr:hypothetical protein B0H13DRAFT_1919017 [Mycena leptocephala]